MSFRVRNSCGVCQPRPGSAGTRIPDPQPGGSNDTRGWWRTSPTVAEFSGCVSSRRRSKLRIVRFRIHAKAHSLRCSSSPNRTRCAGLRFGFGTGDRVLPHTAFVLTWFKIKKRQASASRALRTLECFCCKGFRHCGLSELLRFLRKSGGNGRICQWVDCAYLN